MDIVGAAETGSGKTLAFGIPIVQVWSDFLNHEKCEIFVGKIRPKLFNHGSGSD